MYKFIMWVYFRGWLSIFLSPFYKIKYKIIDYYNFIFNKKEHFKKIKEYIKRKGAKSSLSNT